MKTTIVARKIDLTAGLKEYVETKLAKLDKFFDDDAEAKVTLSVEKSRQRAEATIFSHNMIFRVDETTSDMYVTLDKVIDSMERQIRKNKTRLEKRLKKGALTEISAAEPDVDEETAFHIVKTKTFATKPMSNEEAILQMNLLGHSFFVFKDAKTDNNNIVYKRKDGNYGIIEIN